MQKVSSGATRNQWAGRGQPAELDFALHRFCNLQRRFTRHDVRMASSKTVSNYINVGRRSQRHVWKALGIFCERDLYVSYQFCKVWLISSLCRPRVALWRPHTLHRIRFQPRQWNIRFTICLIHVLQAAEPTKCSVLRCNCCLGPGWGQIIRLIC